MPQVRSANVISTQPCTRPRRLWCLSCATRAYSCSPLTTRCHSGPTRLMTPLVSTVVQPEALSFAVALSVILFSLLAQNSLRRRPRLVRDCARERGPITTDACCGKRCGPSLPRHRHRRCLGRPRAPPPAAGGRAPSFSHSRRRGRPPGATGPLQLAPPPHTPAAA